MATRKTGQTRTDKRRVTRALSGSVVVESRHPRDRVWTEGYQPTPRVTYQRELVLCGKRTCNRRHGPYWYAYWKDGTRTRKRYIGKVFRELKARETLTPARPTLGNHAGGRSSKLPKVSPQCAECGFHEPMHAPDCSRSTDSKAERVRKHNAIRDGMRAIAKKRKARK